MLVTKSGHFRASYVRSSGFGVIALMPDTLISRVEKLTDQQLDAELASQEHNDIGRHIILAEKSRRTVLRASKPRWIISFTASSNTRQNSPQSRQAVSR